MSDRHYGLKVGDRIAHPSLDGSKIRGTVVELCALDNNGVMVKWDHSGNVGKAVAEWCDKLDPVNEAISKALDEMRDERFGKQS